ncbi:MAG: hypothetical protein PWQ18_970 [Clostridia bacterium]|nr:hypothetical protein [Clostridia bacterium]
MTHSLHRQGTRESLERDFVVLSCSAKGYNNTWYGEKGREFLAILLRNNPVNWGDMKTGNFLYVDPQEVLAKVSNNTILEACFDSKENVLNAIKELKQADLGISVVISGVHEVVDEIAREAGLPGVHTREWSLGVHGNTDRLPDPKVMEFTTMCGHGMVGRDLVLQLIGNIKKGRCTAREASIEMGKCCSCGNFNVTRSQELIKKNIPLWVLHDEA